MLGSLSPKSVFLFLYTKVAFTEETIRKRRVNKNRLLGTIITSLATIVSKFTPKISYFFVETFTTPSRVKLLYILLVFKCIEGSVA